MIKEKSDYDFGQTTYAPKINDDKQLKNGKIRKMMIETLENKVREKMAKGKSLNEAIDETVNSIRKRERVLYQSAFSNAIDLSATLSKAINSKLTKNEESFNRGNL